MTRERLLALLRARVDDARVVDAIGRVDRAAFVPPDLADRAWENGPLPIGSGQTISQPLVVAQMCSLLDVHPGDRVLDVGTGSGYHAAVLAALGGRVVSIERHQELSRRAARALRSAGVEGVELVVGDGSRGYPPRAPYDAINVAASARGRLPEALVEQLGTGGRLVAPVGERLRLLHRREDGEIDEQDVGAVRFVPLVEAGSADADVRRTTLEG